MRIRLTKNGTIFVIITVFALSSIVSTDYSFAAGNNRIVLTNVNSNLVLEKGTKHKITYKRYGKAKKGKIRFKSSNKKVVSVSRKGVLTAKKNGTARITVYVKIKGKKKYKRTVKIRVGARVQNITINGYECVKKGKTVSLSKSIKPSNAKNMAVTWSSENSKIAKVSSSGKVTGVNEGETVIKARAKDGSGVVARYNMHVYKFRKGDTKWVAHRGLHTKEKPNTLAAFVAAGKAGGFWGCECDVWETAHSEADDSFGLVINHDPTFKREFGVEEEVKNMTVDDISTNSKLRDVTYLQDFLVTCYDYNMVPVIELKDDQMSDAAIIMAVDMVFEIGMDRGGSQSAAIEFLRKTDWISFRQDNIDRVREYILNEEKYADVTDPMVTYLISTSTSEKILQAHEKQYSGVSVEKKLVTDSVIEKCREYSLPLDMWTFYDSSSNYYLLHKAIEHSNYQIEHLTVDYKPW